MLNSKQCALCGGKSSVFLRKVWVKYDYDPDEEDELFRLCNEEVLEGPEFVEQELPLCHDCFEWWLVVRRTNCTEDTRRR